MERNTQPGRMEAQSRLVWLCPAMECGWLKANLRFEEGCREHPETVSVAVLDDRPDAVPLHGKSHRRELPTVRQGNILCKRENISAFSLRWVAEE